MGAMLMGLVCQSIIGSLVGVERLVDHAEIVPFSLDLDADLGQRSEGHVGGL